MSERQPRQSEAEQSDPSIRNTEWDSLSDLDFPDKQPKTPKLINKFVSLLQKIFPNALTAKQKANKAFLSDLPAIEDESFEATLRQTTASDIGRAAYRAFEKLGSDEYMVGKRKRINKEELDFKETFTQTPEALSRQIQIGHIARVISERIHGTRPEKWEPSTLSEIGVHEAYDNPKKSKAAISGVNLEMRSDAVRAMPEFFVPQIKSYSSVSEDLIDAKMAFVRQRQEEQLRDFPEIYNGEAELPKNPEHPVSSADYLTSLIPDEMKKKLAAAASLDEAFSSEEYYKIAIDIRDKLNLDPSPTITISSEPESETSNLLGRAQGDKHIDIFDTDNNSAQTVIDTIIHELTHIKQSQLTKKLLEKYGIPTDFYTVTNPSNFGFLTWQRDMQKLMDDYKSDHLTPEEKYATMCLINDNRAFGYYSTENRPRSNINYETQLKEAEANLAPREILQRGRDMLLDEYKEHYSELLQQGQRPFVSIEDFLSQADEDDIQSLRTAFQTGDGKACTDVALNIFGSRISGDTRQNTETEEIQSKLEQISIPASERARVLFDYLAKLIDDQAVAVDSDIEKYDINAGNLDKIIEETSKDSSDPAKTQSIARIMHFITTTSHEDLWDSNDYEQPEAFDIFSNFILSQTESNQ